MILFQSAIKLNIMKLILLLFTIFLLIPLEAKAAKVTMKDGTVYDCKGTQSDVVDAINTASKAGNTLFCCTKEGDVLNEHCFNIADVKTVTRETPPKPPGKTPPGIWGLIGMLLIAVSIYLTRRRAV